MQSAEQNQERMNERDLTVQIALAHGIHLLPLHWVLRLGDTWACSCNSSQTCRGPGKHPRSANGLTDASTDPAVIEHWRRLSSDNCNWGLRGGDPLTGGGYLTVVDVDDHDVWDDIRDGRDLPDTWTCKTGSGGIHYFFRTPTPKRSGSIRPGVDVKSKGGYVVAAGSVHHSGRPYAWDPGAHPDDVELAWAPDWLLELLDEPGAPGTSAPNCKPNASIFGFAAQQAGMLGRVLGDNKTEILCPNNAQHSDGAGRINSSCVLFGGLPGDFGRVVCKHAHCEDLQRDGDAWFRTCYAFYGVTSDTRLKVTQAELDPAKLDCKNGSTPKPTLENIVTILTEHPHWANRLWTDTMRGKRRVDDDDLTDSTYGQVQLWLNRAYRVEWSAQTTKTGVRLVCDATPRNPLHEYLRAHAWDGKPRADAWVIDHLGAPDTPYTRLVTGKWTLSAVARAMNPGCKVDTMLVLEGGQGVGKSVALEILGGDWSTSMITTKVEAKDSVMQIIGNWIIEWPELSVLGASDVNDVKGYLTRRVDDIRRPYSDEVERIPRRCVFAGTTNDSTYLRDATGNRRFWPVQTTRALDRARLIAERDQIWAEVVHRYEQGESWVLDADDFEMVAEQQRMRETSDPWLEQIARYVDGQETVTVSGIIHHCLTDEAPRKTTADARRVSKILQAIGWESVGRRRVNGVLVSVFTPSQTGLKG